MSRALEIAEQLLQGDADRKLRCKAAELRRLHEINSELVAVLKVG